MRRLGAARGEVPADLPSVLGFGPCSVLRGGRRRLVVAYYSIIDRLTMNGRRVGLCGPCGVCGAEAAACVGDARAPAAAKERKRTYQSVLGSALLRLVVAGAVCRRCQAWLRWLRRSLGAWAAKLSSVLRAVFGRRAGAAWARGQRTRPFKEEGYQGAHARLCALMGLPSRAPSRMW